MSRWWAVAMLLSGGLFVGGVVLIAWERVPAWRASDPLAFRSGLAHTLRRVDRLQPALLVVCLGSTIGFASNASGTARTLATLAAGGLLVVPVGSVAWLVPIQRRLVASGPPPRSAVEALRARWCGSHLVHTAVALACFVMAVVATPRAGRPAPGGSRVGHRRRCGDIGLALAAWFVDPTTTGSVCSSSRSRSGGRPSATQDHPGAPDNRQRPTGDDPPPPQEGDLS
jgi:hypothetical protein